MVGLQEAVTNPWNKSKSLNPAISAKLKGYILLQNNRKYTRAELALTLEPVFKNMCADTFSLIWPLGRWSL